MLMIIGRAGQSRAEANLLQLCGSWGFPGRANVAAESVPDSSLVFYHYEI